jgi:hypothetical protein
MKSMLFVLLGIATAGAAGAADLPASPFELAPWTRAVERGGDKDAQGAWTYIPPWVVVATNYIHDTGATSCGADTSGYWGQVGNDPPYVEPMNTTVPAGWASHDIIPVLGTNTLYAAGDTVSTNYQSTAFRAILYLRNTANTSNTITVKLRRGQWLNPGKSGAGQNSEQIAFPDAGAMDSVSVTTAANQTLAAYTFDFGTPARSPNFQGSMGDRLVLQISAGTALLTEIYWDGYYSSPPPSINTYSRLELMARLTITLSCANLPDHLEEMEPFCTDGYVDQYNGGCYSPGGPLFQPLPPVPPGRSTTVCGTSGNYLIGNVTYRDTDWYEFVLTEPRQILFSAVAEFPLQMLVLDGDAGCSPPVVLEGIQVGPFEEGQLAGEAGPGRYWLWVGPSAYTGTPCGSRYVMNLFGHDTPLAQAACCHEAVCALTTGFDCYVAGGVWMPGITSCDPNPCTGSAVEPTIPDGTGLTLRAALPNPFRAATLLRFDLPSASPARIGIYDALGRCVRSLSEGTLPAGSHVVVWDGRDQQRRVVSGGTYFVRLQAGTEARGVQVTRLR